jgi:hypothetical protein
MTQPGPAAPAQPQIQVGIGMTATGQSVVVLSIPTMGGALSWQVDPATAESVGAALVNLGRQARSGLIVPPGASMPLPQSAPNGKGG